MAQAEDVFAQTLLELEGESEEDADAAERQQLAGSR
jgi:hypothetical protein